MPFSAKTLEEKPYNMCIKCAHIGVRCDGPNFLAMEVERLCEWCRLRKEYLHAIDPAWTNAYVAEETGLSKISVDRFFSGKIDDARRATVAAIVKALVNGSWGQYPCAMSAADADDPELAAECQQLKQENAALKKDVANFEERVKLLTEQASNNDTLMRERYEFLKRKDRAIRFLGIGFGVLMLTLLVGLTWISMAG